MALHRQGQLPLAEILYRDVLRLAPTHAQTLFHLGILQQQSGRLDEALASFDQALAQVADNPQLHLRRGVALHQLGRFEDALAAYGRALALRPEAADVLNNAGMALHKLGRHDEAIAHYERSLALEANAAETEMNLGVALYELNRFEEARARHERALALRPGSPDVQANLANALLELGLHQEALELYRKVAQARPRDADLQMNLGNVLRDMHCQEEALASYARALALDPQNADVHWNQAIALLTMGDLARGWREYEWRLRMPAMADVQRTFAAPPWRGEVPLSGRTILLHAEQGLGDTLQFCRYAAVLQAQGANVKLEVQRPLVALLRGQPGLGDVIAKGTDPGACDFHCPLMSLPFACGTTLDNVPAPVPYVRPDPALAQRWSQELGPARRPRIGLAWSGNAANPNDHRRSIPLANLLAGLPRDASYWSLQKEVAPEDLRLIEADRRIQRFSENTFEHTAAQIASLDAVVCVDTSIGHLAGALGARTFVLLAHSADWRWLSGRTDTPWYPRHTLLRQPAPSDWASALGRLAGELATVG
nr:tetratricopeptide repeat-containing glycosyltransferase family protein [Ramlibacter paludis]